MKARDGSICGEVNAKNRLGAYTGFTRFVVEATSYRPLLDPQFDFGDLASARQLCADFSGNEYSSVSTTMSTCNRVAELELVQARQQSFDTAWAQHCEGFARQIYRPPLQSSTAQNAVQPTSLDLNEASSAPDTSGDTTTDAGESGSTAVGSNNAVDPAANDADLENDV